MSKLLPKLGDRVQVVYEGIVTHLWSSSFELNNGSCHSVTRTTLTDIEILERPWAVGDVVIHENGTYIYDVLYVDDNGALLNSPSCSRPYFLKKEEFRHYSRKETT